MTADITLPLNLDTARTVLVMAKLWGRIYRDLPRGRLADSVAGELRRQIDAVEKAARLAALPQKQAGRIGEGSGV